MNEEKLNQQLSPLEKIKPVEAPDFLLTRIMQRIENAAFEKVTPRMAWAIGVSLVVLIGINTLILFNRSGEETNLAESMNLMPDNNLYK